MNSIVLLCGIFGVIRFAEGLAISRYGCPDSGGIFGICLFDPVRNCVSQDQCPSGYACCPRGCGSECLAVTEHLMHPGTCPTMSSNSGASCHNDHTCRNFEKCCNGHCLGVRAASVNVIGGGAVAS